jgi:hypothetical protein
MGFKRAMPKYNVPATYHLLFGDRKETGNYLVQVGIATTNTYPVDEGGTVTITIPQLPRGCCLDWYCFTIIDDSPDNMKVVSVLSNGKVIRRLSVKELERLPTDERGYRVVERRKQ